MTVLTKRTSIIILSYNTLSYTKLCIESIRTYTAPGSYELIIIDNGSTDGSAEWLREQPDILLQCNVENRGFPGGCNQGMRLATGDALLLLNSDTIVTPRWLENLCRALDSGAHIGAVGCVTNSCSNQQTIPVNYDSMEGMVGFAERYNHSDSATWRSWLRLVGFCFLWKRSVYARIGGFDERFSPGNYEDDDLSFRIRAAGYELLLCQDTFIHHFGSQSFREAASKGETQQSQQIYENLLIRNFQYMEEKWEFCSDYRTTYGIIESLPKDMAPGTKVCIVNCGWGQDIFYLGSCQPQLLLSGVSLDRKGQTLAAISYPIVYAENLLTAVGAVPEKQDVIILLGNCCEMISISQIMEGLKRRLSKKGQLYYADMDKVYCIRVDQNQ